MADSHKNFSYSTVATAPSPATSGTSLVVASGEGARFPDVPFNATIWPSTGVATPANAEVVRVTARSTDTLTIVRAQEGSTARSVVVGDRIIASITAKTLEDSEQSVDIAVTQTSHGFTAGDVLYYTGSAYAKAKADAAATAEVIGIVSASVTTNVFRMVLHGKLSGLTGLTAGTTYFLSPSTAGAITVTEPTTTGHVSKPVLVADSTTSGYFVNWRGVVIDNVSLGDILIQEIVVGSGGEDVVDFQSIPATYRHLKLEWMATTESSGDWLELRYNNDSGNNYTRGAQSSSSGGAGHVQGADSSIYIGYTPSIAADDDTAIATGIVEIPWYSQTSWYKTAYGNFSSGKNSGGVRAGTFGGSWSNTAAINRVQVFRTGFDIAEGSIFRLLGREPL